MIKFKLNIRIQFKTITKKPLKKHKIATIYIHVHIAGQLA